MSATHKTTLHLSATGEVFLGRASKADPTVIAEPVDVTARFHRIMLTMYGPRGNESKETSVLRSTETGAPMYRVTVERVEG